MEGKQHERGAGNGGRRARAAVLPMGTAADGAWRLRLGLVFEIWRERFAAALALETERRSWFNWLPVAFGLGIGAYFVADREPLWWGPAFAASVLALAAFAARRHPRRQGLLVALTAAALGLWAAQLRTERVKAPALDRITIGALTGFVESLEERAADMRVVLHVTGFAGLTQEAMPARVRITMRKAALDPGQHVRLTARLMPPPEAARPGGYDFARDAFFRGIGAVGSGLGVVELTPAPGPAPLGLRLNARIDEARNLMTARIANLIGGQAGAVAAALVTGKRGLITEETNEILRGAGIYHIVSISGLHMVLAAGAIFWLARAGLALFPPLALGWPIKKIAALCAMAGASAYCVFSGSEVATERSLIMTIIMLGAILVDRPALSMRNLALAALVVLALEPDALLGPSFQMSFGAVAALIAFAEWDRRRTRHAAAEPGLVGRMLRMLRIGLMGMAITSLLAAMATGPFGAYHFQTFNPFGLIGNMLALPFVSLVVMPAAVVGALLYPLGLDGLAWWIMGLATQPVLGVSSFVAGLQGSTKVIPAYGIGALLALAAALLLFTLLTTWLRWSGLVPLALGAALAATPDRPDILIDREASGVAARAAHGRLAVIGKPSAFVLGQWLKTDGDARKPDDPTLRDGAACDQAGCVIRLRDGRSVAWSRQPQALAEDCTRATLVVTPLRWDGACTALMIDRRTLDRFGAISIHAAGDRLTPRTTRNPEAPRLWTRREPSPREGGATAAPPPAAPQPGLADPDLAISTYGRD